MIDQLIVGNTPLYSKYAFLGALRSAAQMVPYEVSIGLILIVRLVSAFGSAKAIVPLTQPGNGPEGTAAWGMSASRRKAHFVLFCGS
jgi:NADH:ubiquinone oxidoreductase subunit H